MIKIEHGIPLPTAPLARLGYSSVLRQMKLFDSIFIPDRRPGHVHRTIYIMKIPGRFTCRSVDGGVRVWRFE